MPYAQVEKIYIRQTYEEVGGEGSGGRIEPSCAPFGGGGGGKRKRRIGICRSCSQLVAFSSSELPNGMEVEEEEKEEWWLVGLVVDTHC